MNKHGFTLVELLVAITIIGVISAVGLVSFTGVRGKTQDSVRKNDLRTLATALELYFQKNGEYLVDASTCPKTSNILYSDSEFANLINGPLPTDPKTDTNYCYETDNEGLNYKLLAKLDDNTDYILTSEDFIASATTQPTATPTNAPAPTATPTPTPLPTDNTTAPPGKGICREQQNNNIQVYVFNDPDYNPTLWPKICGSDSDYCPYPRRILASGDPLYRFTDRIQEQGIQEEERPQDGYNGPITVRVESDICEINLIAYQAQYIHYGLANNRFYGRVATFILPGLVGANSTHVTPVKYAVSAQIPAGKTFTRGTCYIGAGGQLNPAGLVAAQSGPGNIVACPNQSQFFTLGSASAVGFMTIGLKDAPN